MLHIEFDEAKIDAIFADLDGCHLPGAAVGIALAGKPIYRKGFGLASMDLPVCLSPSMRIRIGSTTKQFTCLAYMLLCEEGRAGIDDLLGKHVPEVHPVIRQITLRQLMGNIGGLRDVLGIISQFRGHLSAHVLRRPMSAADVLSLYGAIDDADMPPGVAWRYNNGGFFLLSTVIERVAGQSLEGVMRERIFEPLGMHDTLVRRIDTDFLPNSSTPHHPTADGRFERAYFGYDYAGAGAITSTVDDMLRWMANMESQRVGTAATWSLMTTPQKLANGNSTEYGLGLFNDRYRGVQTIHHAGGWVGASTQALKVPAAGLDVVVMANRGDVSSVMLVNRILDACLPQLEPRREEYGGPFAEGLFRSPTTGRVIRLSAHDGHQIASLDGLDMPMEPDESGTFWAAGALAALRKAVTPLGDVVRPTALRHYDAGAIDELERISDTGTDAGALDELERVSGTGADAGALDQLERVSGTGAAAGVIDELERVSDSGAAVSAEEIVGRYRSETTGIDAVVSLSGEGLPVLQTLSRFGTFEFRLEHLGGAIWRAKPSEFTDGVITFEPEGSGFRFSNLFIRGLRFRRSA